MGDIYLPYSGKYLVQGALSIGCGGGDINMALGINHANQWHSAVPAASLPNGGIAQLVEQMILTTVTGTVNFSLFAWTSGGGGSMRSGRITVTYHGP